jgi:C4-dicarboxylate-specific signal transduction histidine kinase
VSSLVPDQEDLVYYVKDILSKDDNLAIKACLAMLLGEYEKNIKRLSKITTQSDKQQMQMLNANEELNEYKQFLEEKVEQETNARVFQQKIMLQNAKMAEMGNMLGAIIHQWKQPINAISMLIELMDMSLAMGAVDKEEFEANIALMKDRLLFLNNTINDFRTFLKPDKLQSQFSVKDLIDDVVKLLEYQITKHSAIVSLDVDSEILATGYPNEIRHVFINILNNSLDAYKKDDEKPLIISVVAKQTVESIIIAISDNAGGIPYNIMAKLFEPYNTSKGEVGTGIGLSLAKTIIADHHSGAIEAKNSEVGVDFTIVLPNKTLERYN